MVRRATYAALLALVVGAALAPVPAAGGAQPRLSTPSPVLAPFVDMGLWPTPVLTDVATQARVTTLNLAFVGAVATYAVVTDPPTPPSCVPSWGGYEAYAIPGGQDFQPNVAAFATAGGTPVVSFGGVSAGARRTTLAQVCPSVDALTEAYRKVLTRFYPTQQRVEIDFDVEDAALHDQASSLRRGQAVKALQDEFAAADRQLVVNLTLPVTPTGLDGHGLSGLDWFLAGGAQVHVLNLMTMDYGPPSDEMGTLAINAAKGTAEQLRTQFPAAFPCATAADCYRRIGITPMVGRNDVAGETFTLADAAQVSAFVAAHGLPMLGWWEASRDRACASPSDPLYLCSHVAQYPWQFAHTFGAAFLPPPPPPPPVPPSPSPSPTPTPTSPTPTPSESTPPPTPVPTVTVLSPAGGSAISSGGWFAVSATVSDGTASPRADTAPTSAYVTVDGVAVARTSVSADGTARFDRVPARTGEYRVRLGQAPATVQSAPWRMDVRAFGIASADRADGPVTFTIATGNWAPGTAIHLTRNGSTTATVRVAETGTSVRRTVPAAPGTYQVKVASHQGWVYGLADGVTTID